MLLCLCFHLVFLLISSDSSNVMHCIFLCSSYTYSRHNMALVQVKLSFLFWTFSYFLPSVGVSPYVIGFLKCHALHFFMLISHLSPEHCPSLFYVIIVFPSLMFISHVFPQHCPALHSQLTLWLPPAFLPISWGTVFYSVWNTTSSWSI